MSDYAGEVGDIAEGPQFCTFECECEHAPIVHDDGFGCTEPGCLCLAGWRLCPTD